MDSAGIHLHCTKDALIEDCQFKTGDDCIAGINIQNLTVRRCVFNTSCNLFRMGGVGIYVEDCYAYGPGYYPHRKTVVKGKNDELHRTEGRHNLLWLVDYFASTNYPFTPSDMHFKNCVIENAEGILYYPADSDSLHSGTHIREFTLENVRFTDLKQNSVVWNTEDPITIRMKNVTFTFSEESKVNHPFTLAEDSNAILITD